MAFQFNTDLLTDNNDREAAAKAYPHVFFALDDPELRDVFTPIDDAANSTKTRSRLFGIASVGLVSWALGTAAGTGWIHGLDGRWPEILIGFGGLAGVVGGGIGAFGIWFSDAKFRWLERRYLSERLRHLHFQTLISCAPEILKAAETGDPSDYLKARSARLQRFQQLHVQPAAAKLGELVKDDSDEEVWLLETQCPDGPLEGAHANELLQALEDLRITHQLNYAELKLSAENVPFFSSPVRQVVFFSGVAFFAVVAMLLIDLLSLYNAFDALMANNIGAFKTMGVIDAWALGLAVLALVMRALEEGFQSRREVERFRQYRSSIRLVRNRLRAATDTREKLRALREMEEVAYEDMTNFIKSNYEARFVM